MNKICQSLLIILFIILAGCHGKSNVKQEALPQISDSIAVKDTGYTGIKQYMGGKTIVKEVTFKNGVREGLMRTFYQTGEVRQTFLYKNGLRQDSSIWYYMEGQPFRTTPYKNDTIEGIQKQFYRTGELRAKIGYSKGFRTTFLEEYTKDGKIVRTYPDLEVKVTDEYKTRATYKISLSLTDKSVNVRYFRGDLTNGLFDTAHCKQIKTIKGIGTINLKKTGSSKPAAIGVIAEILTSFGNNYLVYKKIELPYHDLN